ncbi:MAG: phosphoribosyltransferase family protein [Cyclobacteriaceae bacterium]
MSDKILTKEKVDQIIRRIAYQIHENNMDEEIVLVGIDTGGKKFAVLLGESLKEISKKSPKCFTITINKEDPLGKEIKFDGSLDDLSDKSVILCDDVLNSGKTLAYSLGKLLTVKLKKVTTAVLILRSHAQFPIYANYKGYELSTTLNEHVRVDLKRGVFLT